MLFSDKCIMGQPGPAEAVEKIMAMAAMAFGGKKALLQKPRILTLVNTLTPMQIDRMALDTIKVQAEYGQPLVITAAGMSGTTAPITPAGALSMSSAEALAAIAISQMLREGTPVVMGVVVVPADMRSGDLNLGAPAQAICIRYAKALAEMYGLPCRCGGCGSDAGGLTAQSGYESMLNMFVSLQEKVDLIIHSAGMLDRYNGMSYEKFITDLEVVSIIEHLRADIDVNDYTLALPVILETGHGGEFLTHVHTLAQCRSVPWTGVLGPNGPPESGENAQEAYLTRVDRTLEKILSAYRKPELDPDLQKSLESFLIETGVDTQFLTRIKEAAERS
jgi:trimethylamine--corrinoid protein Co-methyltransferase